MNLLGKQAYKATDYYKEHKKEDINYEEFFINYVDERMEDSDEVFNIINDFINNECNLINGDTSDDEILEMINEIDKKIKATNMVKVDYDTLELLSFIFLGSIYAHRD